MKRIAILVLSLLMIIGLFSCEKNQVSSEKYSNIPAEETTSFEGLAGISTELPEDYYAYIPEDKSDGITYVWVQSSARFVFLPKDHPQYNELVALLSENFTSNKMVKVTIHESPVDGKFPILDVKTLSPEKEKEIESQLGEVMDDPNAAKPLKGSELSQMTDDEITKHFNLKRTSDGLSNSTSKSLISLSALQVFFNNMKYNTCGSSNPFPCIPFQYAPDGCYSRAHEMKKEFFANHSTDCGKIFTFANAGTSLTALTQLGCTQAWSWHVALLVPVSGVYYVVDPGLFTGPVPLMTWIAAQGNLNNITAIIRNSWDYLPNGSMYQYYVDPYYSHTNSTNQAYSTLYGCSY